jgi:small-conductance mechanosensitive channel
MLREVRAMGLTWRDLVSSAALVAMLLAYWALEFRLGPTLFTSAWAASTVELILGSICAVTAAADLHTRPQPREGRIVRRITTALGSIALVAGLAGLAGNSAHAVEILVVATTFLWLAATVWHVLSIGSEA